MKKYIEDILIIGGLTLIVTATFLWTVVGGLYCAGVAMFGVGAWFVVHPPRKE